MTNKSFFSKTAITEIIEETLNYFNNTNHKVTTEEIGSYLISKNKINQAIYDTLIKKDLGKCHAMVKKGRCCNPITKENCTLCSLHLKNPPEMTWEEYSNYQSFVHKKITG